MKHTQIVKELVKKYSKNKNVVGIYIFGSLAAGTATPKSDIDIEIIFEKSKKPYQLIKKEIAGIPVDLSLYRKSQFIKDFSKPYLHYSALNYKILYDPQGILKKNLTKLKNYFKENPKILRFWRRKEEDWKKYKARGKTGKGESYFEIMKKLERKLK